MNINFELQQGKKETQPSAVVFPQTRQTVSSKPQIYIVDPANLADQQLFQLCKKFGKEALAWKRKFIGLLPEVNRRRLYEKAGRRRKSFGSIFEFAAKLAGVSREQVNNALNLDRCFEDKPLLRKILINGEVSINKLIRITSVVTPENEEFWASQVKLLSKSALETLVRDEKILKYQVIENENLGGLFNMESSIPKAFSSSKIGNHDGLFKAKIDHLALPGQRSETEKFTLKSTDNSTEFITDNQISEQPKISESIAESSPSAHPLNLLELKLNQELVEKLLELQNKGLDINQILLKLLQKRDEEIATEKQRLSKIALQKVKDLTAAKKLATTENLAAAQNGTKNSSLKKGAGEKRLSASRYINVATKKLLYEENGTKCCIPICNKPSKPIHHTQRFALAQVHDPYFMEPLCEDHHQIAHIIDLKVQEKRGFG